MTNESSSDKFYNKYWNKTTYQKNGLTYFKEDPRSKAQQKAMSTVTDVGQVSDVLATGKNVKGKRRKKRALKKLNNYRNTH